MQYGEKKGLISQPQQMLFSSFEVTNGTITTQMLLFYSALGLVCTGSCRFVEYTPVKCFAICRQRSWSRRGQISILVLLQKLKKLANSSYGYQIVDRSRHSVTKYTNKEKIHAAFNNKMFKNFWAYQ